MEYALESRIIRHRYIVSKQSGDLRKGRDLGSRKEFEVNCNEALC